MSRLAHRHLACGVVAGLLVLAAGSSVVSPASARGTSPATARGAPPALAFDNAFVRGRTEAQLVSSYRRLRAMGVRIIRLDFRWISLEQVGRPFHRYTWAEQDRAVRAIRAAGLKVLGILDYGNPNYSRAGWAAWMRGQKPSGPFGVGDPQYFPPDDPRSFARFASDVARRYRSDVLGWEIWNEENEGWRFWEPKEDPAAYARLLCAADGALKRVDSGAPVVFGGLFFPPLGGLVGTGGAKFLSAVLAAGGRAVRRCFDAVAYHPYPYPFTSPEAEVSDRGSVIEAVDQLRVVLGRFGLARIPLWNTEVGWPTSPRGNGVTESRQARYEARLELLSWARGIPLLTWYTWGDAPDPGGTDQEAHFGFFRIGGSAKPAYSALVTLRRELGDGWRFVADRSRALGLPRGRGGVDQGVGLQFAGPGRRRILALWFANERPPNSSNPFARVEPGTPPQSITLRLKTRGSVTVTDLFGHRRELRPGRDGVLRLRVGQDPMYVQSRG